MVYLKYNPKDYQDIQHSRRVISTLFVPFNYLHVASTCAMKEFYAALPRFPYTEYHPQVLKSFGGNNYGCRFDPKFSSNYETANLFAVIRVCL